MRVALVLTVTAAFLAGCGRVRYEIVEQDAADQTDLSPDRSGRDLTEGDLTDAPPPSGRCPAPLPSTWIWCDDFETTDLSVSYPDVGAGPEIVVAPGAVASRAVETHWSVAAPGDGWLWVWFGDHPLGTFVRPGERFDEVWVRFRVLHQQSFQWTDSPTGLLKITSLARTDFGQSMQVRRACPRRPAWDMVIHVRARRNGPLHDLPRRDALHASARLSRGHAELSRDRRRALEVLGSSRAVEPSRPAGWALRSISGR